MQNRCEEMNPQKCIGKRDSTLISNYLLGHLKLYRIQPQDIPDLRRRIGVECEWIILFVTYWSNLSSSFTIA